MANKLYKRAVFREITKYLFTNEVLVLHGARQVGKTHLLYLIDEYLRSKSYKTLYIDLEDSRFLKILDAGIEEFMKYLSEEGVLPNKQSARQSRERGKKIFVLIDEIQYLREPSSFLKLMTDHHKNIKLIVSGSSSFLIKTKFKDALVGRTINFEVLPLSFAEFLHFKEYFVTPELLRQVNLTSKKNAELLSLFKEYVLYGGYPKIVLTSQRELKERYLQQIIDTYIKKDIRDLAKIKEVDKFNKLVEVLATQSGQLLNVLELSNTCHLAKTTVENYLFLLENTYVIKLLKPYYKNLRSELFKTPKIFFYDTGLMQMLWLKQLQKEVLGSVLETAVFAELAKKYGASNLFFWRTTDKKEIDFILRRRNKILPIEVKINFEHFDDTAVKYFNNKYKMKNYFVTGLNGEMNNNHYCYPWAL